MGTFNHSVKVPKLYKCAAKICQEVAQGGGSLKQLVYEKKHFNTKALYALIATTFQKANQIDLLLKRTKLFEKEPRLDPWLAKIFISELMWGKKKLPQNEAKPIQTILAYEQAFKAHLSDTSVETIEENKGYQKPRYVRVNTLLNPFNEALQLFQDEGWVLEQIVKQNDYQSYIDQVSYLEGDQFLKDIHIPDMLIFPCGTEFYNHPGYKSGSIILQDKASCLPAHILSPPPGSIVLDMCAAPGMKTTQLAALLNDEGTVYAVERDPKRYNILNKMIETSGARCIKTVNRDVLECSNSDFPGVEYILVDPSCSGSGMTNRLEVPSNQQDSRLEKLAGFQIKILRSALTRYPQAKRIVYSTCSLYPEENEDVVRQVLETNNDFKLVPADKFVNNIWKNFGSQEFGDIGSYCLYARPEDDLTNGFFLAIFERLKDGEHNQFYNGRVLKYMKNQNRKDERMKKRELNRIKDEAVEGENVTQNFDEYKSKTKKSKEVYSEKEDKRIYEENEKRRKEYDVNDFSTNKVNRKIEQLSNDDNDIEIKPKKSKKRQKQLVIEEELTNNSISSKVKKKKNKTAEEMPIKLIDERSNIEEESKKAKNKRKVEEEQTNCSNSGKGKWKKIKTEEELITTEMQNDNDEARPKKSKKKKKKVMEEEQTDQTTSSKTKKKETELNNEENSDIDANIKKDKKKRKKERKSVEL